MTDLLLDENNDLAWKDGDFVIGDSTLQNQSLLIMCNKTEFKENPMRCVGAQRYLEDHTPDDLAREIRQEFTIDGMKVSKIEVALPDIGVEADYKTPTT